MSNLEVVTQKFIDYMFGRTEVSRWFVAWAHALAGLTLLSAVLKYLAYAV